MLNATYISRCNNCDIYMEDENPSEDSKAFTLDELEKIGALSLLTMERDTEGFPVCPQCKTEGNLMDITEVGQIEASYSRITLMGYGFTEETAGRSRLGEFDLDAILDHDSYNLHYSSVVSNGHILLAGYQYNVIPFLKLFCLEDQYNNVLSRYDITRERVIKGWDEKLTYVVEVQDADFIN